MGLVSHKRKRQSKGRDPEGRYRCVSFRVNLEEEAAIGAMVPEGANKNTFLRDLVLSAAQSVQ